MKHVVAALLGAAIVGVSAPALAAAPTLEAVLGYPFQSGVVAAEHGGAIAWVQTVRGVRNVWLARAPDYAPRQVTANTQDDGQELTNLTFSPDGTRLAWVRGGDHDANWPAEGNLAPDPAASAEQPQVTIWAVDAAAGGAPVKVA